MGDGTGVIVKNLYRRHGFSKASYYLCRSKFEGMTASDAKRCMRPARRMTDRMTGQYTSQPTAAASATTTTGDSRATISRPQAASASIRSSGERTVPVQTGS